MYLHLSSMYPSWAAQSCPRGSRSRFSIDFGVGKHQQVHTVDEFRGFRNFARAHQTEVQKAPKSDPREAKMDPRSVPGGSRSAPGGPRSAPGGPQSGPRAARSAPSAPKSRLNSAALTAKWDPPGAQEPSGILDPPWGDFPPPRGQYLHTFPPSGQHLPNCPLRKAYASIRSASLDVFV